MKHKSVLALFGNVALQYARCPDCKCMTLVLHGRLQCCGRENEIEPTAYIRESEPPPGRKTPPAKEKRRILDEQGNCCFYCGARFGSTRTKNGQLVTIQINWDHQLPFALTQNNHTSNFVAACHVCNGIKSDHVFQTVEEAQVYLQHKRRFKGYDF